MSTEPILDETLLEDHARQIRRLRNIIREEITLLRKWSHESVGGGWSTHQVEPMRRRADMLEEAMMGD